LGFIVILFLYNYAIRYKIQYQGNFEEFRKHQ